MKPAALVHTNTIEEKETTRLLDAIEAKREQVEELTVTIENSSQKLMYFNTATTPTSVITTSNLIKLNLKRRSIAFGCNSAEKM